MGKPLQTFLDLIFPPRCVYCNGVLNSSVDVACPACLSAIPWIGPGEAVQEGQYLSRCTSAAWYEGEMRLALLRFKFYGKKQYDVAFSSALSQVVARDFGEIFDLITWIPVSPNTLKERGYDQARLLADGASALLNRAAIAVFHPPVNKKAQSSLTTKEARQQNIKDCFQVADPALVKGKCILLIDDVVTTGSTLEEAARTLLEAGAKEVLCATLCRTRLGSLYLDDGPQR